MKRLLLIWVLLFSVFFYSQEIDVQEIETQVIPAGYYDNAIGTGYTLKTQLFIIINGHTSIGYKGLWNLYKTANAFNDNWYEKDNTILDIYSEIPNAPDPYNYTAGINQCGNVGPEGKCYNREHLVPQSVFNSQNPMYSDAFHIWPTDSYVNGKRADYPFGRVETVSWTSLNGSKVGNNDNSGYSKGYSGTVFEPIDEFKGDIARAYFYFATRYESTISGSWKDYAMFNKSNSNQFFTDTFKNILLTWHSMDPVSDREIALNDAVYAKQKNRNPFIDHPEWVELIWGKTLGTEDFEYQSRDFLEIYPTLSTGTVYIKSKDIKAQIKKVMVFSMNGILLQTIDNSFNKEELEVHIINSGVYIIKAIGNDFEVNRKVIVK